jgi:uncharacterized protein (DUF427 family)
LEPVPERIRVLVDGIVIADTSLALRVLETSHPPTYYLPPGDVRMDLLQPSATSSHCEWKGGASYWSLEVGERRIPDLAWCYERPSPGFEAIRWMTSRIVGPVRGEPGSWGW